MKKEEIQKRIIKNRTPLSLDLFTWDEETLTLSTIEEDLTFNFEDIEGITFKTGDKCSFKTWDYCYFKTGNDCTFKTGEKCTFKTEHKCSFQTKENCTFETGHHCTFKTGDECTFKTRDHCSFDTGDHCTFKTGDNCSFQTDYNCSFQTRDECTFDTWDECTFKTGDECTFKTLGNCSFKTGKNCTILSYDSTFNDLGEGTIIIDAKTREVTENKLNPIQASNESKAKAKGSVYVDIVDSDIATIEALHDLLLDAHGYSLDFITLKRARELTTKMYKAFE